MQGLTEGRMCHYVLPEGRHAGEHRAAVVAKVWDATGVVNLQVFTDGENDAGFSYASRANGVVWVTSAHYSEELLPHTWHWIEKA